MSIARGLRACARLDAGTRARSRLLALAIAAAFIVHGSDLAGAQPISGAFSNADLWALGGAIGGDPAALAGGSVGGPLTRQLRTQFEIAGGPVGRGGVLAGAAQIFWRDPSAGRVGADASFATFDGSPGGDFGRIGASAEAYVSPFVTVGLAAGVHLGDDDYNRSVTIGGTAYPTADTAISFDASFVSGDDDEFRLALEHLLTRWGWTNASVFARANISRSNLDHSVVLGGMRIAWGPTYATIAERDRHGLGPSVLDDVLTFTGAFQNRHGR